MKKLILLLNILALTLGLFATVSVTGAIVGSDNPTAGLGDGVINLYGVIDYTANTNASGQFVVEDVLSGNTYNYAISRAGYQSATGTIIVGSTSYDMGTITLNETTLAPSAIVATVNDADTAVNLTWEAPPLPGNYYFFDFEQDNGDWVPSSNWTNPLGDWEYTANYDVANWNPSPPGANIRPPLAAYSGTGMWGTKINTNHSNSGGFSYLSQTFDFSDFDNTQLKFWSWENVLGSFDYCRVSVNGIVVWGPSYDFTNTIWRERSIDLSAYDGMSDVDVRFEMYATTSVNYAGWYIDDVFIGPAADVVRSSQPSVIAAEFRGLSELQAAQLAEERSSHSPAGKLVNSSRDPSYNPSRIPLGYKVWRLVPGQENAPALWVSLTPAMITDTTFTDPAWESFPDGFYKWAVRTIYSNDVASAPGFSNTIRKQSNDMSALSISGSTTPSVGTASLYIVRIKNVGTTPQAAGTYAVKIMSGTTELASIAGPAIAVDQTLDVAVNWNPTTEGEINIYGKAVLPDDSDPTNDATPTLSVTVMEEGLLVIGIGHGNAINTDVGAPAPYGTYYKAFRQQFLLRADEIYTAGGIPGIFLGLAFNVYSIGNCTTMSNYRIRLKETDQTVLDTTFETGEYTTVWQRASYMPVTDWNVHTFDEPFLWNGISNVIVEIVTGVLITPPSNNALTHYSTTDFPSSLRFQSNSVDGSTGTTGTVSMNRSNIRFFMVPAGGDPVFIVNPSTFDFGDVNLGGSRNQTFTIINAGGGTLNINAISIAGSPTMTLSSLPTLPAALETAETAVFTVTYTPGTLSEDAAIVIITDDQDTRHVIGNIGSLQGANSRDTHTIALSGTGVNDITIGEGNQTGHIPFDFRYTTSLFETIYTIDELSNFVGMIAGVKFYNQFSSNLTDMPIEIWLGSTTQTSLQDGWIPSTDLTQVYDGVMDFPSGENIINITFPEPYLHLDGGNLVMMTFSPMDGGYYSSSDYFKTQTVGSNRSREVRSDGTACDPANPTGGTVNGVFPKTTFAVIPDGVGHITGTVQGADANPLPGVQVYVDVRAYTTVTDALGQFTIPNLWPNDYAVTLSRHGYVSQTINITLDEDETEVMNVTMDLMAQVAVTGTILASDTGSGIAGANINLVGYENYSGSSTGNGSFTIPTVFANHSYDYTISAAGYTSTSGTIDVAAVNYGMGNITLNEIAYAPNTVEAELNAAFNAANLSWNAPDPNAIEVTEGFEAIAFPPADWSQIITNTGAANPVGVLPTWCSFGTVNISGTGNIAPTEGVKQAGLWWDYTHQDEWLLTPSFNCPPDAHLTFDSYATLGSINNDHYYVKVSSDGGNTWTVLWDATAQAAGENHYAYPISVDLAVYAGTEVKLAFHAEDPPSDDGLWYEWFIDNVYIGNFVETIRFAGSELTGSRLISSGSNIGSGNTPQRLARAQGLQSGYNSGRSHSGPARSINRTLEGYKIWRLPAGQENNEAMWTSLTDETITALSYEDQGWATIPNGTYKWAIKALYTADVMSAPAFSNSLVKEIVNGNIVGFVRKSNGQGIGGASITAEGGYSTTANVTGAYSLSLPAGIYSVTATHAGYDTLTQVDIAVSPNQNTTLNFTMIPVSNADELVPVTATALRGNYPNPFNPTTTISYDLKDAASVRLNVYNVKGQLVRSLVNSDQASGRYRVVFNACDDKGNPLSSGIYLYRLTAGRYNSTRKMMLME